MKQKMFQILSNASENCTQFLQMCKHGVNLHTYQRRVEKGTTDNSFPRNNFKFHRATSVPKPTCYKVQTLAHGVTFTRPS